ncbi:glycosyltransferase family 4 protein [Arthrobacter sp. B3I4]|uniref:glycosyltransferase family 4 protein n=1 Tax=Arthrobacter sp. B3I4 TaxID=3042267 RepID=UPI002787644B|nr:glycosyltransferase family 4 protein [Arthrobacter sp. B3I4]MDQ0755760.1 glycosyltransferase involved in cell wall biosynthesis [Arthrobacter sp. B3I4]
MVNNYLPSVGGVEFHVAALAKQLAGLGVRVTVFCLDNDTPSQLESNPRIVRLTCTPAVGGVLAWPWPGTSRQIRRILKEAPVTAISTHTRFFPMSLIGARLARRLGVPCIHTEHGSAAVKGVSPLVGLASKLIDRTVGRLVLRGASRVLCISEGARDFVRNLAGVDGEVFHNAIDTGAFTAGGTGRQNRVVYVGRIVPGKGWELALATAEQLAGDYPQMELHIVGDGTDRTTLAARAAASPLADRVIIHGQQPPARIAELLRGSVFLNPTTLSEGFQTTLLEAVAAGAAVVSTPVGAARYLLAEGADIRLVEAKDPDAWVDNVRAALDSPAEPPAAALVDSFDWKSRAAEYLAVVDSLRPGT